jgi:Zn-dependent M28 family amino/carboxypeptidase
MMEAMRILKQSGVTLRRTVRIGLWNAEEEGLIGSRVYVQQHYGGPAGGGGGRGGGGGAAGGAQAAPAPAPVYTAEHAKFAGYFNIDNGTGAIRGIYLQGNQAVAPIFRQWIEPFRAIGMTTVTIANTGGTDHQSFDGAGLPGFQFTNVCSPKTCAATRRSPPASPSSPPTATRNCRANRPPLRAPDEAEEATDADAGNGLTG